MENYFMINGEKIPMSEETTKSLAGKMKKTETYENVVRHLFDGNYCYYTSVNGRVFKLMIPEDENNAIDSNNAPTKEQLESILALNKLANVAKYLNGDWLPYFSNPNVSKYYISYNKMSGKFLIFNNLYICQGGVYFKTKELAQKAIDILGEDEVKKALTLNH